MKEILFRGKCLDDGTWVEGYYTRAIHWIDDKPMHILLTHDAALYPRNEFCPWCEVNPNTVCQYTGVNDRTGRKIFEHDIISVEYEEDWWSRVWYEQYEVYFSDKYHAYRARHANGDDYSLWEFDRYCTVIGNTIDNPKLMEG
jgi:uncharacterized phage protein (TIGR01671 family)